MNYTEKYHLPQWEETDRILRTDFNRMCADIEAGIAKTAQDAAANLPYAIGTYTGTGANLEIKVGFRPRLVIISGQKDSISAIDIEEFGDCCVITTGNSVCNRVQFTDTGFIALVRSRYAFPDLTQSGRVYDYIAFK